MVIITKQCPPLPKPTLDKLTSKQLLQMLGLNAWGVTNMLQDAHIMNGKEWKFTRNDLMHLLYICTRIENGMGC